MRGPAHIPLNPHPAGTSVRRDGAAGEPAKCGAMGAPLISAQVGLFSTGQGISHTRPGRMLDTRNVPGKDLRDGPLSGKARKQHRTQFQFAVCSLLTSIIFSYFNLFNDMAKNRYVRQLKLVTQVSTSREVLVDSQGKCVKGGACRLAR
jgi:hypothetical protein